MNYFLSPKYLPATLIANEGKMTKTVMNMDLTRNVFRLELVSFASGDVTTAEIPTTPKKIDEMMNILVAIFCIG
jgi:hypothetical protein